jgi:hypothetical protein
MGQNLVLNINNHGYPVHEGRSSIPIERPRGAFARVEHLNNSSLTPGSVREASLLLSELGNHRRRRPADHLISRASLRKLDGKKYQIFEQLIVFNKSLLN